MTPGGIVFDIDKSNIYICFALKLYFVLCSLDFIVFERIMKSFGCGLLEKQLTEEIIEYFSLFQI